MARTERKIPQRYFLFQGIRVNSEDLNHKAKTIKGDKSLYEEIYGFSRHSSQVKWKTDYESLSPDGKPWDKPNKSFKQMERQKERAKAKQAIIKDKDPEKTRKSDKWNWT